jgi:hypothetical protein
MFKAQIRVEDKPVYIGIFKTKEEAYSAYVSASTKLHGEFGCHG